MRRNYDNTCLIEGCENPCWKEVCKACGRKIRYGALPEQFGIKANPKCAVEGCNDPRYTTKGDYCRGHYSKDLEGVDPATKRHKRKNGTPAPDCSVDGCTEKAVSKGKCPAHRRDDTYTRRTSKCAEPGCTKRTSEGYCALHLNQFTRYGITWSGKMPKDRLKTIREAKRPVCSVPHCSRKTTSQTSILCPTHMADKSRKGLSPVEFVELVSRPNCEACGAPEPTATDHDHSCPHPRDGMCPKCIRGRLCNGCNTALGYVQESSERLRALAVYIERFQ